MPTFFQDDPHLKFCLLAVISWSLLGCASVTVTPLAPDGTAKAGGVEGVKYYMPAPYLLVAELPPSASKDTVTTATEDAKGNITTDATKPSPATPDPAAKAATPTPSAPVSDTSFAPSSPQYAIKLIYLPDKTQPMSLSEHTGLFGTAQMKPSLQDGWMLTALDASADNKTAETITAISSLIGSVASLSPAGAATKAAGGATKAGTATMETTNLKDMYDGSHILIPGLYKLVYSRTTGELIGVHRVAAFGPDGVSPDVKPSP